jgi:hypothetical protein
MRTITLGLALAGALTVGTSAAQAGRLSENQATGSTRLLGW